MMRNNRRVKPLPRSQARWCRRSLLMTLQLSVIPLCVSCHSGAGTHQLSQRSSWVDCGGGPGETRAAARRAGSGMCVTRRPPAMALRYPPPPPHQLADPSAQPANILHVMAGVRRAAGPQRRGGVRDSRADPLENALPAGAGAHGEGTSGGAQAGCEVRRHGWGSAGARSPVEGWRLGCWGKPEVRIGARRAAGAEQRGGVRRKRSGSTRECAACRGRGPWRGHVGPRAG
jgi:hypothetical protein